MGLAVHPYLGCGVLDRATEEESDAVEVGSVEGGDHRRRDDREERMFDGPPLQSLGLAGDRPAPQRAVDDVPAGEPFGVVGREVGGELPA